MLLLSTLALLSLSAVTVLNSSSKTLRGARQDLRSQYVCEAGLSAALFDISIGGSGEMGDEKIPVEYGDSTYWVESTDLGDDTYALVSTGVEDRSRSRVEVVVRMVTDTIFLWAAFGDEELTMDSNAFSDSYDSTVGPYDDQVNGNGANAYANQDGDVGSNGNIAMDQNALVNGDGHPGPGGSIAILGNAEVTGATTPMPEKQAMPPLSIPSYPMIGAVEFTGSSTLPSGNYRYSQGVVDGNSDLTVTGPATLVFDSLELESSAEIWVDSTNGPVEIYVRRDFIMDSNTLISSHTHVPRDVKIYLESDNVIDPSEEVDLDEVDFDSNAQVYGTIYAPNASIEINSNFELFGALVARRVHLDSNCRIHYDESLRRAEAGGDVTFETISWREVAAEGPVTFNAGAGGEGGSSQPGSVY